MWVSFDTITAGSVVVAFTAVPPWFVESELEDGLEEPIHSRCLGVFWSVRRHQEPGHPVSIVAPGRQLGGLVAAATPPSSSHRMTIAIVT